MGWGGSLSGLVTTQEQEFRFFRACELSLNVLQNATEREGKKVRRKREKRAQFYGKPSPKHQHPPTSKERGWAHSCPSGLSTLCTGWGWGDTCKRRQRNRSQPEDPMGKLQIADPKGNRCPGPMREGGQDGVSVEPSQPSHRHPNPQLSAPGTSQSGDCLPCQAQSWATF